MNRVRRGRCGRSSSLAWRCGRGCSERRVCEQPLDDGLDLLPIDDVGVEHHAVVVVGAQRQQADAHDARHLIDLVERLRGALAHVDGVGRTVGRVGGLADVVEQQHALAGRGVPHLDPVGVARRFVGDVALNTLLGQLVIGQPEQMLERLDRKSRDAKIHDRLLKEEVHQSRPLPGRPPVSCSRDRGVPKAFSASTGKALTLPVARALAPLSSPPALGACRAGPRRSSRAARGRR